MSTMSFIVTGGVNVEVVMTEVDGAIVFAVNVLDDTGSIGDLNGLFFDLANDSFTNTLHVSGLDVTGSVFKADSVTKVSSYNTMQGEVINDLGKFDAGIQFGTSGIGKDDIRSTSFVLTSATGPLSLADFAHQDFGVRLTSVGEEGGSRDGSLKLGGQAGEVPTDTVFVAVEDSLTVQADEGFNDVDSFEFLDSGSNSVLFNDLAGTSPYSGSVVSANGDANAVGQIIVGDNGGYMILNADGTTDFSAYAPDGSNSFLSLNPGESAVTHFTYGIDGGATATISVTVFGLLGGGGVDLGLDPLG